MNRILGGLCCLLWFVVAADAQDIEKLEAISGIVSFTKTADSVTFDCADHSQVRIAILSPDLVRVRAAVTQPLPARDHSWAIAKQDWATPRWNLSEQTERLVYLPAGVWYDFWTNNKYSGSQMISVDAPLDTVPMFVRGGAIIPMWPAMNYVGERKPDPITFAIYPDAAGRALTTLYEDDGVSPAYKNQVARRTTVTVSRAGQGFRADVSAPVGNYNPGSRNFRFVVKDSSEIPTAAVPDLGKARQLFLR